MNDRAKVCDYGEHHWRFPIRTDTELVCRICSERLSLPECTGQVLGATIDQFEKQYLRGMEGIFEHAVLDVESLDPGRVREARMELRKREHQRKIGARR